MVIFKKNLIVFAFFMSIHAILFLEKLNPSVNYAKVNTVFHSMAP